MSKNYESKAITTKITANSKCTIKLKDNYYSIEFTEERELPSSDLINRPDINLDMERQILFDDVNAVVDEQINQILDTFKK